MTKPILVATLALIVLGAACQPIGKKNQTTKNPVRVQTTASQAFGSLKELSAAPTKNSSAIADSVVSLTMPPDAPAREIVVKPEFIAAIRYVFTGTPLALTASVDVLKRNPSIGLSLPSDLQTRAGLGVVRLQELANARLETMTIRSGDESWYVSPLEGMISMSLATMAGQPVSILKGETTVSPANDMAQPVNVNESVTTPPVDTAAVLRIANNFLTKHGILTSPYGEPIITSSPSYGIEPLAADSLRSTPPSGGGTQAQVVYPLMIKNVPVVQQSGDPVGLTLAIDVASQTVMSLYGLTTLEFTQSAYEALTDFSVVQKIAEQGGIYGYYGGTVEGQTTTINLGTPDRVLMSSYQFDGQRSTELYVAALRFPLINPPDGYSKWIIVPLAKELATNISVGATEPAVTDGAGAGTKQ